MKENEPDTKNAIEIWQEIHAVPPSIRHDDKNGLVIGRSGSSTSLDLKNGGFLRRKCNVTALVLQCRFTIASSLFQAAYPDWFSSITRLSLAISAGRFFKILLEASVKNGLPTGGRFFVQERDVVNGKQSRRRHFFHAHEMVQISP